MIVLGFDTATPATAVGLRLADGTVLVAHDDPDAGQRPGHVTRLLPLAGELLARANLQWADVQRIAVGLGPGTFTGLRIGVASARGLAQSLSIGVVGVSTARALAEEALAEECFADEGVVQEGLAAHALAEASPAVVKVADGGTGGGVLAVIDARRGEAFAGAYTADGELIAPAALAPAALAELLESARARRSGGRWLAVGDGALRFREPLERAGALVPGEDSPLHRVSAAAICRLALAVAPGAPETVLPDYVRRPDAEIALEGAGR